MWLCSGDVGHLSTCHCNKVPLQDQHMLLHDNEDASTLKNVNKKVTISYESDEGDVEEDEGSCGYIGAWRDSWWWRPHCQCWILDPLMCRIFGLMCVLSCKYLLCFITVKRSCKSHNSCNHGGFTDWMALGRLSNSLLGSVQSPDGSWRSNTMLMAPWITTRAEWSPKVIHSSLALTLRKPLPPLFATPPFTPFLAWQHWRT